MKIAYIHVEETNHPLVGEGFYTLEEFETLANAAASATSMLEDSDIQLTIYFSPELGSDYETNIQGILYLNRSGDWGLMDWIGSAYAQADDEQSKKILQSIEKTIH